MTILEKKSLRKKKAILNLVDKGEYSVAYALMLVEELSDAGKLTDNDYDELATYLEDLLNEENKTEEVVEEPTEEANIEENASNEEQDAEMQVTEEEAE